jgi:hypothetical protein
LQASESKALKLDRWLLKPAVRPQKAHCALLFAPSVLFGPLLERSHAKPERDALQELWPRSEDYQLPPDVRVTHAELPRFLPDAAIPRCAIFHGLPGPLPDEPLD